MQTYTIPTSKPVNKEGLRVFSFRGGMWVTTKEGLIGILKDCTPEGLMSVQLVNGDGSTKTYKGLSALLQVYPKDIRQAYLNEIPLSRINNVEKFLSMGYERK